MEGRATPPGRTGEDTRRSTISCGGVPRYQTQWLLRSFENSDCGSCAYYEAQRRCARQPDQMLDCVGFSINSSGLTT